MAGGVVCWQALHQVGRPSMTSRGVSLAAAAWLLVGVVVASFVAMRAARGVPTG